MASAQETVRPEVSKLQEKHATRVNKADHDYLRALGKLNAKFVKRGDLESAELVARIIESRKPDESGLLDLCQIRVDSKTSISVATLKQGVPRLSGGYQPSFSFVTEDLEGAQFIRAPWKSKPSYQVTVLGSGYMYLMGLDSKSIRNTSLQLDVVPHKIKGSYIGAVYAVHVTAGQSFECAGYEICLIANEISLE